MTGRPSVLQSTIVGTARAFEIGGGLEEVELNLLEVWITTDRPTDSFDLELILTTGLYKVSHVDIRSRLSNLNLTVEEYTDTILSIYGLEVVGIVQVKQSNSLHLAFDTETKIRIHNPKSFHFDATDRMVIEEPSTVKFNVEARKVTLNVQSGQVTLLAAPRRMELPRDAMVSFVFSTNILYEPASSAVGITRSSVTGSFDLESVDWTTVSFGREKSFKAKLYWIEGSVSFGFPVLTGTWEAKQSLLGSQHLDVIGAQGSLQILRRAPSSYYIDFYGQTEKLLEGGFQIDVPWL